MTANSSVLVIAVPTAVIGAASFGMASVVQQRATKQMPQTGALNPRLLLELVRKPAWVVSVLAVIVGLSLQMSALAFGPLMLVQPLLLTSVVFGAVFAAWIAGRRVDRILMLGVLFCIAGLAAFLVVARPSGARDEILGTEALPLALVFGVVVGICLLTATRARQEIRMFALALATGVLYGVTAALMKVVAGSVRASGPGAPFHHWALYVVCLIGPAGFLLSQNAFQRGRFLSPALTVIVVVDPLVGLVAGVGWFGEYMVTTPAALAGEVVSALVLIAGIALLIHRSEHLRRETERAGSRSNGATGG